MLRKIGLGAGFWAIMFIGVSAFMVTPIPDIWQKILEIVLAGAAGYILGLIYFKKTPGDIKDGLILGVIWFIVGGILDLLITVQYVKGTGGYVDGLKNLYGMWSLWVSFVALFIGIIIAVKTTHGGALIVKPPVQPPQKPTVPPLA